MSSTKVVILAGGFGTRISEESHLKPKPMIEIGGQPILWHIMKIYSYYGFNDFIICLGYKGIIIKEYFSNYFLHTSDITFDFRSNNKITYHNHYNEPWRVTLVDTGLDTMTGGRIKRIEPYVGSSTFMLTYGDGVSNINIKKLFEFHKERKKYVTMTSIQPFGRFGSLSFDELDNVVKFREKPKGESGWVNGGFMVMQPEVFNYLHDDTTVFENGAMEKISCDKQLVGYKFNGFWQPMDTLRDKNYLEDLWKNKKAPWKVW